MTATIAISLVNNIGFGSFDRLDAAPIYSLPEEQAPTNQTTLNRQDAVTDAIRSASRTDRGWTYLFTPDYSGQKVHIRLIGATTRSPATNIAMRNSNLDWAVISTPTCSPNSVVATQYTLYVACVENKILVYDISDSDRVKKPILSRTINSDEFNELIALALDKKGNLWVSSKSNGKIIRISNPITNPQVDRALINSPNSPAGITFDVNGSLWAVSTDGIVLNIPVFELNKNSLAIDATPTYCMSNSASGCEKIPDSYNYFDYPEGIAILNNTIWVSSNGDKHPGHKLTALQVSGNKLIFLRTVNSFSCPGGLFSDNKDLYVNDQSYGLGNNTTCGYRDGQAAADGVLRYRGGDLNATPTVWGKSTSRPGFGGITVVKIQ